MVLAMVLCMYPMLPYTEERKKENVSSSPFLFSSDMKVNEFIIIALLLCDPISLRIVIKSKFHHY